MTPAAKAALVGPSGLEPPTSRLSGVCSNLLSYEPVGGGGKRIRTDDPLLAGQVLYQLSYTPIYINAISAIISNKMHSHGVHRFVLKMNKKETSVSVSTENGYRIDQLPISILPKRR